MNKPIKFCVVKYKYTDNLNNFQLVEILGVSDGLSFFSTKTDTDINDAFEMRNIHEKNKMWNSNDPNIKYVYYVKEQGDMGVEIPKDMDSWTPIKDNFCPICGKQMYNWDVYEVQSHGFCCEDMKCFMLDSGMECPDGLTIKDHYFYRGDKEGSEIFNGWNKACKISMADGDRYIKQMSSRIEKGEFAENKRIKNEV